MKVLTEDPIKRAIVDKLLLDKQITLSEALALLEEKVIHYNNWTYPYRPGTGAIPYSAGAVSTYTDKTVSQ